MKPSVNATQAFSKTTIIGGVAAVVNGMPELLKAFQQYPQGASCLEEMVICGLASWVLVTLLNFRRK